MNQITFALPKGRLAEETIKILKNIGIECSFLDDIGRKLVLTSPDGRFKYIFVKPGDVPTYVEHGIADIGVAGKDTLLEERKDIYEMLDLKFGVCNISVAGRAECENGYADLLKKGSIKVASKYTGIAKEFFTLKGVNAEIIKLHGSVELGPVLNLSDVIVDVVESGKTLVANGLSVYEKICDVSARLVVNKTALKTKRNDIMPLVDSMKKALNGD